MRLANFPDLQCGSENPEGMQTAMWPESDGQDWSGRMCRMQ